MLPSLKPLNSLQGLSILNGPWQLWNGVWALIRKLDLKVYVFAKFNPLSVSTNFLILLVITALPKDQISL